MTVFNQKNQSVETQYNALGDINIGTSQSSATFVRELEKLKAKITLASESKIISRDIATDAEYEIQKAVNQAKQPDPSKKTIVNYLEKARNTLKDVAQAGGIVAGLVKATELVEKIF